MDNYYSKYFKSFPATKKQSAQLTSSNSLVGNKFTLLIDKKKSNIKLQNKFGYSVAELNEDDSKLAKL